MQRHRRAPSSVVRAHGGRREGRPSGGGGLGLKGLEMKVSGDCRDGARPGHAIAVQRSARLSLPRVPSLHLFGLLIAVVKRILSPVPRLSKDLHCHATTLRRPALLCYGSTKICTCARTQMRPFSARTRRQSSRLRARCSPWKDGPCARAPSVALHVSRFIRHRPSQPSRPSQT
jgi:hypothetical protein